MKWDWSAWGDFLQGVGSILQAGAIVAAGYWATNTLQKWKEQTLESRRIEQAERILNALYAAIAAIKSIRSSHFDVIKLNKAFEKLVESDV